MNKVIHGDCFNVLPTLPSESVDLIVTDPPYGYSFMGKDWDKAVPSVEIWKECLRVLKAGAFAFVMSAPRSDVQHQMIGRLMNAGFELAFTPIYWTYASGFPKAMNIGKMVDKRGGVSVSWFGEWLRNWRKENGITQKQVAELFPSKTGGLTGCVANWELGLNIPTPEQFTTICRHFNLPFESIEAAEREVISREKMTFGVGGASERMGAEKVIDLPETDAAKALDGSYGGFQPKPAVEVIIVAMKPLSEKTFVDQALKNGKGITWLDDCRIPSETYMINTFNNGAKPFGGAAGEKFTGREQRGRFPANLLISDSILDTIDSCISEDFTQIADEDLNLEEDGTRESTTRGNLTHQNVAEKSPKLSKGKRNQKPTDSHSQRQESPSMMNGEGNLSEAQTETEHTANGCELSENGITTPANTAEIKEQTEKEKDSTFTTSKHTPPIQSLFLKSQTDYSFVIPATQKQKTTGTKNNTSQYSRYFDLDAWAKTLPFLVVAKASKREKDAGLTGEEKPIALNTGKAHNVATLGRETTYKNNHPTVKPLKLMSYLITLGSRPGDVVLDPFLGSGTTALAAKHLGRSYIGIEKDSGYVKIAQNRLNAMPQSLFKT